AGHVVSPTDIIPGPDGRVWFTGGPLTPTSGVGAANASIFGLSYAYYDSANDTEALAVGSDGNVWIGQSVFYASNNGNGFGRINTSGVYQSGISIDSLFPVS